MIHHRAVDVLVTLERIRQANEQRERDRALLALEQAERKAKREPEIMTRGGFQPISQVAIQ